MTSATTNTATSMVKRALRHAGLAGPLRSAREALSLVRWASAGRRPPTPHAIKRRKVRKLAHRYGCSVLVETGTFEGDMVAAMLRTFGQIYSIELGSELWQKARDRFAGEPKVTLLHGDSASVLGELLPGIDRPCLFWLDGHYSAGVTARSSRDTPIVAELAHLAAHPLHRSHVILIDDARLFTGAGDYPTMDWIRTWARDAGYAGAEIEDDVIVITPARP